MGGSGLVLLVGLLALWAQQTAAWSPLEPCPSGGKPGSCPKPQKSDVCGDFCSADDACPGALKCCSQGCGRVCTTPLFDTKPGECPKFKIPAGLPCKWHCCQDSDCPTDWKCCQMGCSWICARAGLPPAPDQKAEVPPESST